MEKRSVIIGSILVTVLVVGGLAFLWLMSKERPSDTGMSVQSMPAGDGTPETAAPTSEDASAESIIAGMDDMTLDRLMAEIEAAAGGDETALEDEYAAETESFMDGAVVMQELGTSYDETSY